MTTSTASGARADLYPGIQPERVQTLSDGQPRPDARYVLYWMQQSQRTELNHALEYALHRAGELDLPVLVAFGLTDGYPEANLRHYAFMLQGLQDVAAGLADRGIAFVLQREAPDRLAVRLAADAALVVCDRGYLRPQRAWRESVAAAVSCPVVQVESDVVVPVQLASNKKESAARTLRPKVTRHLDRFLVDLPRAEPAAHTRSSAAQLGVTGEDLGDLDALLAKLELDRSVAPVPIFRGGTSTAKEVLSAFLRERFPEYVAHRNQPQTNHVSHMSKYLHFGQVSPVYIALQVREYGQGSENVDTYLEELIVRRELPMNFVFYEPDYDRYRCLPAWAQQTLAEHASDPRQPSYTAEQLENAETEDPYWNAAMTEMKEIGYLHNHMRMYWGKQILRWAADPEEAHTTTLRLNNKYFLDGRDANSYANVAWVFGQHDRGWAERPVFGKTRTMTPGGLERKSDPEAYVRKVQDEVAEVRRASAAPN